MLRTKAFRLVVLCRRSQDATSCTVGHCSDFAFGVLPSLEARAVPAVDLKTSGSVLPNLRRISGTAAEPENFQQIKTSQREVSAVDEGRVSLSEAASLEVDGEHVEDTSFPEYEIDEGFVEDLEAVVDYGEIDTKYRQVQYRLQCLISTCL